MSHKSDAMRLQAFITRLFQEFTKQVSLAEGGPAMVIGHFGAGERRLTLTLSLDGSRAR